MSFKADVRQLKRLVSNKIEPIQNNNEPGSVLWGRTDEAKPKKKVQ